MNRLFRIVLVSCCLGLFWIPLGSCNEAAQPILSLDLRKFGYLRLVTERDLRAYTFLHDALAFLDDGTLAVSFYRKNDQPGFSRRDGTPGSEVLFHSVLLDPVVGSVKSERTWGNAGDSNALLPLDNGGFLIQDGEWVRVYSREMKEIAGKKLEYPGDILPRFAVSASGRSLYEFQDWYDAHRGWLTRIDLLDQATLLTKQSKLTPGHQYETVSDNQVVYLPTALNGALHLFVYRTGDSAPAKRTQLFDQNSSTAKLLSKSHCSAAALISNSILAISGDCGSVFLTRSGEIFQEINAREFQFGSDIRPSREGTRFGFTRSKARAHSETISNLELCVYDISRHKLIFTFSVSPLPQHKLGFALSPDGSLLALQSDSLLRVWSLSTSN